MDSQPVKTTLYSLSDAPPRPSAEGERRDGERHLTLYRIGAILAENRRELCLIKNISAGGMMIHLYRPIAEGTPVTVELKSGQPVSGKVNWIRDQNVGITFDQPIDVIDILTASMNGPRPRMPRIEINCHAILRDGANVLRVQACDISQGGVKVRSDTIFQQGADVIVTLPGLEPRRGVTCWTDYGFTGITFNRVVPFADLVAWLQKQREMQHNIS